MTEKKQRLLWQRLDAASPTCAYAGCDRKWDPTDSRTKTGGVEGWGKAGDVWGCTHVHCERARKKAASACCCTETA